MSAELIFMGMKQKKIKMANSKKLSFSTPPILNIFTQKFKGLVLGSVEYIDARTAMYLNLHGCHVV